MNIGANQEAIEHFLSALALQESSGGGKSEQLWTTLRRAFQTMVRRSAFVFRRGPLTQSGSQRLPAMADMAKPGTSLESVRAKGYDF